MYKAAPLRPLFWGNRIKLLGKKIKWGRGKKGIGREEGRSKKGREEVRKGMEWKEKRKAREEEGKGKREMKEKRIGREGERLVETLYTLAKFYT